MFYIKKYISNNIAEKMLTHMDAVPDNFLFNDSIMGEMHLQLIDWEYAGMQIPMLILPCFVFILSTIKGRLTE